MLRIYKIYRGNLSTSEGLLLYYKIYESLIDLFSTNKFYSVLTSGPSIFRISTNNRSFK